MSKKDINIKVLEKRGTINGLGSNFFKFKLSGSDINYVIVNTIVRIGLSLVGSYTFNPDFITIERNTSIFNNDQMRLRISNIPIINKDYKNMIVPNNSDLVSKCIDLEIEANTSIFQTKKDNLEELELIETKKKELLNNLNQVDLKTIGNEMKSIAEQNYTWNKITNSYHQLFLEVAKTTKL